MKLENLRAALQISWSKDTAFPTDQKNWTPEKPGYGQCGVTALTIFHFLGGEILERKHNAGRAFYNRLPDGTVVDLTEQGCESADGPERVRNPRELLKGHTKERFHTLLQRVESNLAAIIEPHGSPSPESVVRSRNNR